MVLNTRTLLLSFSLVTAMSAAVLSPAVAETVPVASAVVGVASTSAGSVVPSRLAKGRKTRLTVQWTTTTVTAGTPVVVTGTVKDSVKGRRKVVLMQKTGSGWRTVAKAKTEKTGAFALAVPTTYFYSTDLRVQTPRKGRSPGDLSKRQRFAVVPTYLPAGDPTTWTPLGAGRKPRYNYRINPCRTIRYRVNAAQGYPGQNSLGDVQAGIAQVAQATGITFTYVGDSATVVGAKGAAGKFDKGTDLVVSWARPDQTTWPIGVDVNTQARGGGVGKAYAARIGRKTRFAGRPIALVRKIGVVIDSTNPLRSDSDTIHVMMHELGHTMGLDHTTAPDQIMNNGGAGYALPLQWGAGDLTGLEKTGVTGGCVTRLRR